MRLDRFVRTHTTEQFGPVRAVEPQLVLEIAFDAVFPSSRHKSGLAMRFPRVHRIRWDKPAAEADTLETVQKLVVAARAGRRPSPPSCSASRNNAPEHTVVARRQSSRGPNHVERPDHRLQQLVAAPQRAARRGARLLLRVLARPHPAHRDHHRGTVVRQGRRARLAHRPVPQPARTRRRAGRRGHAEGRFVGRSRRHRRGQRRRAAADRGARRRRAAQGRAQHHLGRAGAGRQRRVVVHAHVSHLARRRHGARLPAHGLAGDQHGARRHLDLGRHRRVGGAALGGR